MTRSFFVTGTDTEVGKTAVSCALLEAAASAGLSTAAVKPVAAGCDERGHNEDALQLMASMTAALDYAQVNPVALQPAIAPHIAAAQAGRSLQASRLAGLCRGVMSAGADLVLIEGAGGWRVPLSPRETLADLARELGVGVILVVGMRLGCINHALLTAEAVRRDGLPLAGWVANQPGARMSCHPENLDTLQRLLPAPFLGEVPRLDPWDASAAAEFLSIRPLVDK
ncbi:dethiobiotin synthase [Seongchinamella sediminis]|uniref:ATP-dependent dethiobiotin synthetase BioD n=1 Tax=Seongchinamella sediminis TaxID=2283635 RepID=A0A3L7DZT3_9GAMM|nr:dethiobiotin synthase [Seongchinamella sediminis]RLQ22175.1 dethiobiotin synthase [Seongchinamella sediminis]